MSGLRSLHPVAPFLYFAAVIFITMFTTHPVLLGVSFFCAVFTCGFVIGAKKTLKSVACALPVMLVIALTNPLFSRGGVTTLFYLNGNPVTKEAVLYGADISVMITAVFYWFKCYAAVMSGDKFVCLFGSFAPKLALLLSMTLGFLPKLKRKHREIDDAQRALGIYSRGGYFDKIRSKMRVLSILVTCGLESSVETADSMRARGYGLKGRSVYSPYRFTLSDAAFTAFTLLLTAALCFLFYRGAADFRFYPTVKEISLTAEAVAAYVSLFALSAAGIFCEIKENALWRLSRSKI